MSPAELEMPPFLSMLAVLLALGPFIYILHTTLLRPKFQKNYQKLPPGPRPLPIFGSLHILGNLPHRTLHQLAKKYGPIMSIKLGQVPTIVVSSPDAAELFLKTHDAIFASRPQIQANTHMTHGKGIGFAEYGPYWRDVRKLCTLELFTATKIQSFSSMRKEELGFVLNSLKKAAAADEVVDFGAMISNLIRNITYKMVLGQSNLNDEVDIMRITKEMLYLAGAFNIADFVPWLGAFDLQGLKRRMHAIRRETDEMLDKIMDEHEEDGHFQRKQQRGLIDTLLSMMKDEAKNGGKECILDRNNIKTIVMDLIVAALDTSVTTIEWTFSELLRNPGVMESVQKELETVVGMNRMVDETDLPKLTYLNMVIKESFRLHPVGPLLVPRESMEDVTINGHYIPKKSRILVNVWAIGQDPNTWSDNAQEFIPERFKDKNIDVQGHNFELIPFGSGRRRCPGMQMGLAGIQLILAQLLHCFNWELPVGMTPSDLDMTEVFRLAMERATHLPVVPKYRLFV